MLLADLLRRRRLAVAAAAGAVVGALVGLFLPIRAADPPEPENAAWSLPNALALQRFSDENFQSIRSGRYWGELALPGERRKQQAATWTLTAILTRPRLQVAVGQPGKPGQAWVSIGQPLPDGSTLVAATRDRVWYSKDGCRRVRSLYRDSTNPDPEDCLGSDGRPLAPAPATAATVPGAGRASAGGRPPAPAPMP